eukprot:gene19804-biopygen2797
MPLAKWKILPCGGSDHAPLVTDVELKHPPIRRRQRRERWAFKKADWQKYPTKAEELLAAASEAPAGAGVRRLNDDFTHAIIAAARTAIPRGRGGAQKPKAWWTEEVAQAVGRRQAARRKAAQTKAKEDVTRWNRVGREVKKLVEKAKRASWRERAEELSVRTDAREVYSTIRAMDGRRGGTGSLPALSGGERRGRDRGASQNLVILRRTCGHSQ